MSSDYRKELIKAGILVYWNRKTASKGVGMLNCLRQLDSKLDLQLHEKQLVHTLYFNHLSRLSIENSIGQLLLNKILAEISTSTVCMRALGGKSWVVKLPISYQ